MEKEIEKRIEFTHALVHELKTPLTPIMLASDTLTNVTTKDNKWRPLIDNINQGAYQLNRRINELIDLARSEIGVLDVKIEQFDLNTTVIETVAFFKPKANYYNHSIFLQLTDKLPKAAGDSERINQVISNLLDNAIKYSGNGSKIIINTKVLDEEIVFEITDNGKGIPVSKLTDVFNPYNRNYNHKLGGLGLGLALSKSIIDRHNGRIWVKSTEGNGCSFFFTIPVVSNHITRESYEAINC